jgi:hypothetical protein
MATTENDEYLLAQSPQEWKWLLQDEGLIPEPQQDEVPDLLTVSTTTAPPDFATINDSANVGDALDWLQQACSQDLKWKDSQLEQAKKRSRAIQNHVASLEKRIRQDTQQYNDLPEAIRSLQDPDAALLEETISKFVSEVIEPQCLEHVLQGWNKHVDAVRTIEKGYQQAMQLLMAPPQEISRSTLQILRQVLENSSSIDSLEAYRLLGTDVKEMQSFLQTRHRLVVKKSIPSFLAALATMEGDDNLGEHVSTLQSLLDDMSPPSQIRVWWHLWQDDLHRKGWIAHYGQVQSRIQASKATLKELRGKQEEYAAMLEDSKVSECRAQIMRVKKELEAKITHLFDFEDSIEIHI